MAATLLLEDYQKANEDELQEHLDGLLNPPQPVVPDPDLQRRLGGGPALTPSDVLTNPLGGGNAPAPDSVITELTNHVNDVSGLNLVGSGLTNLQRPQPAPAGPPPGVPMPNAAAPTTDLSTVDTAVRSSASTAIGQQSQFGDPQLTADEAVAACGPAAAVRFAQLYGRNPTLREATDLAATVGWNQARGMAGLDSEKALFDKMQIPSRVVYGSQWDALANEARTGNPVVISTPGHYFTADGFDPASGKFHVGRSGTDLRGGNEWMSPAEMERIMGTIQGGLIADHPSVPAASTATSGGASTATTAGLSGGGTRSGQFGDRGQAILAGAADAASWLGPDGQKAVQAILITEGGLNNARGDQGLSAGPLQFYGAPGNPGQLTVFANQHNMSLEQARRYVESNPLEAVQWAIGTPDAPGYLGRALKQGADQGLSGASLATYGQRHGQVSVSPERAGANYQTLFGGGQPLLGPSPVAPTPSEALTNPPVTPTAPTPSDVLTNPLGTGNAPAVAPAPPPAPPFNLVGQGLTALQGAVTGAQDAASELGRHLSDLTGGAMNFVTGGAPAATPAFEPPTPSDQLTRPQPTPLIPSPSPPPPPDQNQSAGDRLKQAFGDFIDQVGGAAGQAGATVGGALSTVRAPDLGQLVAAPGGGLPASAQPTPSDVLTNPPRVTPAPGVPPISAVQQPSVQQPSVLPALGEARDRLLAGDTQGALASIDQARDAIATSPVAQALGGAPAAVLEAAESARQALARSPAGAILTPQGFGEALQAVGQTPAAEWWRDNSVLNQMQVLEDLTNKYPKTITTRSGRQIQSFMPDFEAMTPEDRDRFANAIVAVGGVVGTSTGPRGPGAAAEAAAARTRVKPIVQGELLPDMPRTATAADRVQAVATNGMLSGTNSMVTNAFGASENFKRPVVTAGTAVVRGMTGDLRGMITEGKAAVADVLAQGAAIGDALSDFGKTVWTGRRPSQMLNPDVPQAAFPGPRGLPAEHALRVMGGTDELVGHLADAGAQGSEIVRLMDANPNLTRAEVLERFGPRLTEAGARARGEATYLTGGTGIGDVLARARAKFTSSDATLRDRALGAVVNVLAPFSKVPDVLLTRGASRIPGVNEARLVFDAGRATAPGASLGAKRALASTAIAEAVNIAIFNQVTQGNITGNGPNDPDAKRALMLARDANGDPIWSPNSFKVVTPDGHVHWISYSSLGPIAVQMGAIANGYEQYMESGKQVSPDLVKATGLALRDTIADAWYLQTAARVFKAMSPGGGGPGDLLWQLPTDVAERYIPENALLNQIRGYVDPYTRERQNPLQDLANMLPGASQLVPPKLDPATGQPVEARKDLLNLLVRGAGPGEPNLANEILARHNMGVSSARDTITMPATKNLPSVTIAITPDEQRRYDQLAGERIAHDVIATAALDAFKALPIDQRRKVLESVISDARDAAKVQVWASLPRDELVRRMDQFEAVKRARAEPGVVLPASAR